MRFPDFLIIGAMKSATTTMYRDLLTHPRIRFSFDKEPNILVNDDVLTDAGRRAYAELFAKVRTDEICGEASTTYSKLPDIQGVPRRAYEVLGGDIKLIYVVRNPIERTISHHHHEVGQGNMPASFEEAMERHPELVAYSRYGMQLGAWLDYFDRDQIKIVVFEEYVRNRKRIAGECMEFLGVTPITDDINVERAFNKSDEVCVHTTGLRKVIQESAIYRRGIRPFLGLGMREMIRSLILPKPPGRPPKPSLASMQRLVSVFRDDIAELCRLTRMSESPWTFAESALNGEHATPAPAIFASSSNTSHEAAAASANDV